MMHQASSEQLCVKINNARLVHFCIQFNEDLRYKSEDLSLLGGRFNLEGFVLRIEKYRFALLNWI